MKFIGNFIGADNSYNSLGHRCKELKELNLDNYILFAGCSHTLGEGLTIEKTFSYLLSKQLCTDYYNLAISGSGIDVLLYNLTQWFNTVKYKPRGPWDNNARNFIVEGIDIGFFEFRKITALSIIKSFNVPYITFTHGNTIPYENDGLRMKHLDFADDNVHSGIESHKNFADILAGLALDKY